MGMALIYVPTKWKIWRKTKLIPDKNKISYFILLYIPVRLEVKFVIPSQTIWEKGLNSNSKILTLASKILVSESKTWGQESIGVKRCA